jgi:hypothetical protein
MNTVRGVIRGRTIELAEDPALPDGQEVKVTIELLRPPFDAEAFEALKRAAGGWSDDVEGLDRYLEWNRQQRKDNRREIPE